MQGNICSSLPLHMGNFVHSVSDDRKHSIPVHDNIAYNVTKGFGNNTRMEDKVRGLKAYSYVTCNRCRKQASQRNQDRQAGFLKVPG